jgi:hypothetical protein
MSMAMRQRRLFAREVPGSIKLANAAELAKPLCSASDVFTESIIMATATRFSRNNYCAG